MGTITMSGFNKIDWTAILSAVMQQERQPLNAMQTDRSTLQSKANAFGTLATRLSSLETAASGLTSAASLGGRTATVSDESTLAAAAGSTAMTGTYDIEVNELARAQVTTLGAADALAPVPDKDKTVVATGGNLTFLDVDGNAFLDADGQPVSKVVSLAAGSYTLQQLADAINAADMPAHATIVQADGDYRLVLTGSDTGKANGFTLQNNLDATGGVALAQATPMAATDADVLVNKVRVTSSSNVITDAVDGVTLTLLRKTSGTPVTLSVAEDPDVTGSKMDSFVGAFNSLVDFINSQATAARKGDKDNIGFDPLVRSLHSTLSGLLNRAYPVSGAYQNLASIGLEFDRQGKLKMNASTFSDAMKTHRADVEKLLAGDGTVDGAFDALDAAISDYTKSGGLVPDAKSRMEAQAAALGDRIDAMERRLAVRQAALQAEYSAADSMISQLNSQAGSLSSLGASYSAF